MLLVRPTALFPLPPLSPSLLLLLPAPHPKKNPAAIPGQQRQRQPGVGEDQAGEGGVGHTGGTLGKEVLPVLPHSLVAWRGTALCFDEFPDRTQRVTPHHQCLFKLKAVNPAQLQEC